MTAVAGAVAKARMHNPIWNFLLGVSMPKKKHPNLGTTLDQFLKEDKARRKAKRKPAKKGIR